MSVHVQLFRQQTRFSTLLDEMFAAHAVGVASRQCEKASSNCEINKLLRGSTDDVLKYVDKRVKEVYKDLDKAEEGSKTNTSKIYKKLQLICNDVELICKEVASMYKDFGMVRSQVTFLINKERVLQTEDSDMKEKWEKLADSTNVQVPMMAGKCMELEARLHMFEQHIMGLVVACGMRVTQGGDSSSGVPGYICQCHLI